MKTLLLFIVGVGLGFMLCFAVNEKPALPKVASVADITVKDPCSGPREIERVVEGLTIDWGREGCRWVKFDFKGDARVLGFRSDGVVVWRKEGP